MMKKFITVILILIPALLNAQSERKYIREGVRQYEKGEFSNAEVHFRKAQHENEESFIAKFNTTTALYGQEKYRETAEKTNGLLAEATSPGEEAMVYHNLGNSLLQQEKFRESIEAYKNSLRINPGDDDTRYNLAYAMEKLREQEQQQQQQQDQQQNEQEQEQQENEQQQDQQQNEQEQEQQENEQQENRQQDQQENEQQQQRRKPGEMSQEEAERLLNAILQKEKEVKEDVDREKAKARARTKTDKDW